MLKFRCPNFILWKLIFFVFQDCTDPLDVSHVSFVRVHQHSHRRPHFHLVGDAQPHRRHPALRTEAEDPHRRFRPKPQVLGSSGHVKDPQDQP